jgi:hypothetical protein
VAQIQGDRIVAQHVLKHLLMFAILYHSIGLINTQYRYDYTRAHTGQLSSNSRSARMSFSQLQRIFIVKHYLASRSYLTCQNELRAAFPDTPVPNKSIVSRLVNCFSVTGSVQNRKRSGRPSVLSDDSLDDIRQTLLRSSRKSLRKLSVQSGLSYRIVHKATKILKLDAYRVYHARIQGTW